MFFLDVEETLIKGFDDPIAINHEKIAKILNGTREVSLFTFGLWDDAELLQKGFVIKHIEEAHNIIIRDVWHKSRVLEAIRSSLRCKVDEWDVSPLFGKGDSFIHTCKVFFNGCECTLVDDLVENCTLHFPDRNLTINMIKV
jgi:hypothetical protein